MRGMEGASDVSCICVDNSTRAPKRNARMAMEIQSTFRRLECVLGNKGASTSKGAIVEVDARQYFGEGKEGVRSISLHWERNRALLANPSRFVPLHRIAFHRILRDPSAPMPIPAPFRSRPRRGCLAIQVSPRATLSSSIASSLPSTRCLCFVGRLLPHSTNRVNSCT